MGENLAIRGARHVHAVQCLIENFSQRFGLTGVDLVRRVFAQ
jgi:hypothetical protein